MDKILSVHPKSVEAMLQKANLFYRELMSTVARLRENESPVTSIQKQYLDIIHAKNIQWFKDIEALGWREPTPESIQKYIETMQAMKR